MESKTAGSGTARDTPKSSSASALVSTLIPVAIQAAVFVGIFLLLRPKQKRVYQPRTYLNTLRDDEKSTTLPAGKFSWINPFKSLPDEYVLNHQSLDGYLYLRFLKMVTIICFVGACLTWPVLFPVNATGGGGQKELDLLSFSNISGTQKNRYYAHVFLGWIFFSFVMWVITRETIYFINLRHAYMLSPFVAAKMSSRTVLFTDVPAEYQNKEKLSGLFGHSMRRSWLSTDCKDVTKLVEERDKDAMKLENAEIKLSQTAVKAKIRWEKKNEKTKPTQADSEAQTTGSQWLQKKDRPTHRTGKIPFIGKKVDTIEWSRTELRRLIPEVQKSQMSHTKYEGRLLPSLFVEFTTQQAAQAAFRRMSPRKQPKMNPRAVDAAPSDVIWENLKISATQRKIRKIATQTFITLMIVFWAIPVAVVGAISNINYLMDTVPFLSFIGDIPPVILGLVTGLLPSIMLAVLMALVPIVCRWMAKLSGEVTVSAVELKTQGWYMAFQVIQVFLITTFASGAAAVIGKIIDDPSITTNLLAENLPKASNFFISYFILQGLGLAAGNLLNIGALVMLTVVGKFLDKSPRKMFKRYITLSGLGWGSLYPRVGNLAIIAITYSIISPLVLGFATIGFALIYLATRYNTFYVLTNNIDTKGLAYAKVLQQIMTGVYLGEVCLLGLFAINTAPGPIVLQAVFLGVTAIYHAMMRHALRPLTKYLPDSLDGDNSLALFSKADHQSYDSSKADGVPPSEAGALSNPNGKKASFSNKKASFFSRSFDPKKFKSHQAVRSLIPNFAPPSYTAEDAELAYFNPNVTSEVPRLWIVRDEIGISAQEVRDCSEILPCTDEFARFDEKGKVVWVEEGRERLEGMPIWEKRVDY